MNAEEIANEAKWLCEFYNSMSLGGCRSQFFDQEEGWVDDEEGPNLGSRKENWRIKTNPRKFWLDCGTMMYTGKEDVARSWRDKGCSIIEAIEKLPD